MQKKISFQRIQMRRIFAIDKMIHSEKPMSATQMAAALEVDVRTVGRDIEYMRNMMNAPIEYDRAHHRYYYSEPNFFVKAIPLCEGELFSVALFDQLLEQYRNTPLEKNLRAIFAKIAASLPDTITFDASFLHANVTFISDHAAKINLATFKTVFDALQKHVSIAFDYRPLQKTTFLRRIIDPYHAVCQRGNWYVIGRDHDKGDVRIFSLSRMQNSRKTRGRFTIPDDFHPSDYFDKEMGVWFTDKKATRVELVIAKEIGSYALDRYWNSTQKVVQRKDGSVRVSFKTNQMPEVLRWVLGQGSTVRVLNPPELIKSVQDEAKKMLKTYAKKR